jgi:hypothetical protein
MESVEFNPGNPSEYNDFVPEAEKKRINIFLWTATAILVGFGIYGLYRSYLKNTFVQQKVKNKNLYNG